MLQTGTAYHEEMPKGSFLPRHVGTHANRRIKISGQVNSQGLSTRKPAEGRTRLSAFSSRIVHGWVQKGDNRVSTSIKTAAKPIVFEPENKLREEIPDWLTRCHGPIEQKIKRDWSNLRAAGLDYYDFADHLLELIAAVEDSGEANTALPLEPKGRIVATRLHGCGTNVLRLKLLIE
jgi:hypothetical protein